MLAVRTTEYHSLMSFLQIISLRLRRVSKGSGKNSFKNEVVFGGSKIQSISVPHCSRRFSSDKL